MRKNIPDRKLELELLPKDFDSKVTSFESCLNLKNAWYRDLRTWPSTIPTVIIDYNF
ncbi:MAG: hypothetical protein ACI9FB_001373 [Candidatus Azotimanducaceae bacterium]|jgi:hypothetical protein